jgi:tetratricopeptide (TPR) repeat protein
MDDLFAAAGPDLPDDPHVLNDIAVALHSSGLFELALAFLDKAVSLDPAGFVLHFNRARLLACLRRFDEARLAYERALEINPLYGPAIYALGCTLIKLGDRQAAFEAWEKFLLQEGDLETPLIQ